MEKKLIIFKVAQFDHSRSVAATSLSLMVKAGSKERLLAYMIEESENCKYYNKYGQIAVAKSALGMNEREYRKAFNELLLLKAIIKLPSDKNTRYCHYGFHKTIKRLIR